MSIKDCKDTIFILGLIQKRMIQLDLVPNEDSMDILAQDVETLATIVQSILEEMIVSK